MEDGDVRPRRTRAAPATARRLLECVAVAALLCAAVCSGFTLHEHHAHHHHARHHPHHPRHPASPESTPDTAASLEAVPEPSPEAGGALREALQAAQLDDSVWGAGGDVVGVPLFMRVLLHDTERGDAFAAYNQPVAPGARNKTLASSVQPSRVTVGRAGAMVVEFPRGDHDEDGRGRWLVLALRPGRFAEHATLSVFLAGDAVRPLGRHALPADASFVAVDVTGAAPHAPQAKASPPSRSQFVVEVSSPSTPVTAATSLEVAGWERGPLLVSALDWGQAGHATGGGALRVWKGVPHEVLHPPMARSRRRSHRRTTSTTTEGPAFSSAENPLRNAATAEVTPDSSAERLETAQALTDERFCHLEAWTVSIADLGWQDIIVAPKTLEINFCVGSCPPALVLAGRFNTTTNAIARTAIKRERGAAATANIPAAQCVPISYKPIALLMFNKENGKVDLFTGSDLSADRCGCR